MASAAFFSRGVGFGSPIDGKSLNVPREKAL
jgi:hypothetical protein